MTLRRPHFQPGVLPFRGRVGDDACDERSTTTADLAPNGKLPSDHRELEADVDEPSADHAESSDAAVDMWDGVFRPDDPRAWWLRPDGCAEAAGREADEDGTGTGTEPEGDDAS